MSATITTGEAIEAVGALRSLVNEKMPVKLAMQVRRLVRGLSPVVEDYSAERQKLIEQYAHQNGAGPKTDEDGNILLADPQAFHAGHRELLAVEHEVGTSLDASALEASGIEIAPGLLIGLGPLLVE